MANTSIADLVEKLPPAMQQRFVSLGNQLGAEYYRLRGAITDSATGRTIEPALVDDCCFFIMGNNMNAASFNLLPPNKIPELEASLGRKITQTKYCRDLSLAARQAFASNPSDKIAFAAFIGEAAFHLLVDLHGSSSNSASRDFSNLYKTKKKFFGLF
jgi:hypothetical protein